MYKTVLVPVDLSHIEKGSEMIERAKYLADTNKSQLTLLISFRRYHPTWQLKYHPACMKKSLKMPRQTSGIWSESMTCPHRPGLWSKAETPQTQYLRTQKGKTVI